VTNKRGLSILGSEHLLSARPNSPGSMAVVLLALLPVPTKLSKSTKADQYKRQVNADRLQEIFEFNFAPWGHVALDGVPPYCADGNVRKCFPILSARVEDHIGNVTLLWLKSKACPIRGVPAGELGTRIKNYRAGDYARYERYGYETRWSGSGQVAPMSSSAALVSISAKTFYMDFSGSRRLTCTPWICSLPFITDYLTT